MKKSIMDFHLENVANVCLQEETNTATSVICRAHVFRWSVYGFRFIPDTSIAPDVK